MEGILGNQIGKGIRRLRLVCDSVLESKKEISCAGDVYKLFMQCWEDDIQYIERAKLLLLSKCFEVIGIVDLSCGGADGVIIDSKVVFTYALLSGATSVIIAHNHPSGNLRASKEDIEVTEKLVEAGKILNIVVYDHIVLSSNGYISMLEECLANFG